MKGKDERRVRERKLKQQRERNQEKEDKWMKKRKIKI